MKTTPGPTIPAPTPAPQDASDIIEENDEGEWSARNRAAWMGETHHLVAGRYRPRASQTADEQLKQLILAPWTSRLVRLSLSDCLIVVRALSEWWRT